MNLQEMLMEDLKGSMRRRDELRVSVLRLLRAAIKNAEVEKLRPLDDSEVLRVIEKEAKQRRESIAEFARGNRPDLVAKEEAELAILMGFLPQQMSRDEVETVASRVVAEVGAKGPGDIGKVMQRLMAEVRGKADGKMVSQVVQELLGKK